MDKKPIKQYLQSSKRYDDSTSSEDEHNPSKNNSRRSGIRFSTAQEFLDSLNTTTTAVPALQGLQRMSLESYQKFMQGQELGAKMDNDNKTRDTDIEDEGKGDAEPKRKCGENDDIPMKDAGN